MSPETPFIDPHNWASEKRHKLFSKITLFGTFMGMFHTINDASLGLVGAPLIDGAITAFIFLCYLLNRKRYYRTSRIMGMIFLNLIFAVYASLLPADVGVYLFYFPLIAISAAIFGPHEKLVRNIFIVLSLLLLLGLFLTDFNLIGPYSVEAEEGDVFFLINLFSSMLVLVMCINFIINVNEESERQLIDLTAEVRVKNTTLEKTNAELDRFLYSTSHDLRSPLLSIKGLVNITRYEKDENKLRKYLDLIEERADRLDFFIRDIIDYSKNARTDVNVVPVDFKLLIDEICSNLEYMEGARAIKIEKHIGLDKPIPVDRQRISIVLNNLIANAIKYHNIFRPDPWVKINVSNSDGHVNLQIADNGQGIGIEHQEKIFGMFYRGSEHSTGSGLGLYIAKEAVQKMRGVLRVESQPGEGSTFYVRLPIVETDAVQMPEPIV